MANTSCNSSNVSSRVSAAGVNPFAGNPAVYTTPDYVEITHFLSIRLGHTNNVSVLVDGTQAQQRDYVQGILTAALVCFAFFTLWLIIILIFKCCGHEHVGFFSGQRIRRPMPPSPPREEMQSCFADGGGERGQAGETDEEKANRILAAINNQEAQAEAAGSDAVAGANGGGVDDSAVPKDVLQQGGGDLALNETDATQETRPFDANQQEQQQHHHVTTNTSSSSPSPAMLEYRKNVEAWQAKVKKAERVQRHIRIVVILCCVGVIISAILMIVNGVDALVNSMEDVSTGLGQTAGLATTGQGLIQDFVQGQDKAANATQFMLLNLNQFCPAVQKQLCVDILTAQDCNYTGVPFEQEIQQVVEYYSGMQDLMYKELDGFQRDLQKIVDTSTAIDKQIASFHWAFYVAAAFAALLAVLSLFVIIGIILAWNEKLQGSCFRWMRNLVVVPIFVLLVFLSLLFSCIFVIGSITTSDVCYNSPDNVVLQVLDKNQKDFGTFLYRFLTFYVSGCPQNVVPLDMNNEVNEFLQYLSEIKDVLQGLQTDPTLIDTCGTNENGLMDSLQVVSTLICFLANMILNVRDFFNCNNWNPIYTTFAYDAVCYNATKGFVWISSTQLAIVFFAMMIVMLRVACYEIEDEEDFKNQRRLCARLCSCCCCSPASSSSSSSKEQQHDNDEILMKPLDSSTPGNEPTGGGATTKAGEH